MTDLAQLHSGEVEVDVRVRPDMEIVVIIITGAISSHFSIYDHRKIAPSGMDVVPWE